MVQFLFEFEAYFDQVCRDINPRRTYNAQLLQKKGEMVEAWDLSGAFEKEVDRLENQLQEYLDKKSSFDDKISSCRARISELNKEITNLEKKKSELEWEKSFPTRETIDQEVTRGVKHGEVTL